MILFFCFSVLTKYEKDIGCSIFCLKAENQKSKVTKISWKVKFMFFFIFIFMFSVFLSSHSPAPRLLRSWAACRRGQVHVSLWTEQRVTCRHKDWCVVCAFHRLQKSDAQNWGHNVGENLQHISGSMFIST